LDRLVFDRLVFDHLVFGVVDRRQDLACLIGKYVPVAVKFAQDDDPAGFRKGGEPPVSSLDADLQALARAAKLDGAESSLIYFCPIRTSRFGASDSSERSN
jgi:hypothetical protein